MYCVYVNDVLPIFDPFCAIGLFLYPEAATGGAL